MKIIKPLKLSLLTRPYRFRQQNHFAVSPICFFELGSGKILSEADGWKTVMQVPGMETGFDVAMPKKYCEFLAMGKAYAPEGTPVKTMTVSIRLGDIEKRLKITGNREWKTNVFNIPVLSKPEPFTEMDISWANAYGGKQHPDNPSGKGYQKKIRLQTGRVKSIPWPNVEDPEKQLKKPGKKYNPQSFGMIDIVSAKRQKKAGTYTKKWLKNDYPGFPDDIDWSVYNAACERQWFKGFVNGDETYEIQGMHPELKTLAGALPTIRTRVFISQVNKDNLHFKEIKTHIDTVWFLPDINTGILIFRGRTIINDSDALDVKSILIAFESMGDPNRPVDYYKNIHDVRSDINTAAAHVFNESQLSPEKSEIQLKQEADERKNAQKKHLEEKQKAIEASITSFPETAGMALPDSFEMPVAQPDPVGVIPEEALKRNDFDLSEILGNVEKLTEKHMEEGKKKLLEIEKKSAETPPEPNDVKITRLKKAASRKARIKTGEGDKETILTLMQENNLPADGLEKDLDNAGRQLMEARRLSPEPLAPDEDYPVEVSLSLRDLASELIRKGESLSERDFAGADFSNMDFSGFDLAGIMLEKADLSGCRFQQSNLTNAVLNSAILDEADFSGARMRGVNLCNAHGRKTRFSGCDFTGAMFIKASLTEADFSAGIFKNVMGQTALLTGSILSDCQFNESLFVDATLDEVVFDTSKFNKCIFTNSTSEFSSFKKAEFTKCALVNIEADGSDFSDARLKTVQFAGDSLLRSCNFSNIDARECGFRKGDFADSCFNGGALIKSDLGDVSLARTSIKETVFSKSIMMGSDIQEATIENADFYEALLRKADFTKTELNSVSFFSAELSEAVMPDKKQMKGIMK